jgi:nucleotide-binding universal stress UspA family protein
MQTVPIEAGLVAVNRPPLPFKRLLVPLDGSALAERALPFARALAHLVQGDLILVQAALARGAHADPLEAQLKAAADAEDYLARLASQHQADYAIETSVPFGPPAEEIVNVASLRAADLIVMTTHGRTGLSRMLVGSVAQTVLRKTALPVLLVRGDLPIRCWEAGLRTILVPLDGSEPTEMVLPHLASLAAQANARLVLLQVITQRPPELAAYDLVYRPEEEAAQGEAARAYLARLASGLSQQGLQVEIALAHGRPAEQIAERASALRCDLIAMSTRARSGLGRLIVGSVADDVLHSAQLPLLLLRQV